MKRATIREFRSNIADLIAGEESVLVTKHGRPAAVVYPLGNPKILPLELRRKLYLALAGEIAKQLDGKVSDEQIEREFSEHKKRRRRQ